jgi:hypothetical protein
MPGSLRCCVAHPDRKRLRIDLAWSRFDASTLSVQSGTQWIVEQRVTCRRNITTLKSLSTYIAGHQYPTWSILIGRSCCRWMCVAHSTSYCLFIKSFVGAVVTEDASLPGAFSPPRDQRGTGSCPLLRTHFHALSSVFGRGGNYWRLPHLSGAYFHHATNGTLVLVSYGVRILAHHHRILARNFSQRVVSQGGSYLRLSRLPGAFLPPRYRREARSSHYFTLRAPGRSWCHFACHMLPRRIEASIGKEATEGRPEIFFRLYAPLCTPSRQEH